MKKSKKAVVYARETYKLNWLSDLKVLKDRIVELVGQNNKILDVGCYDGTLGERLIKKNNDVYGIEINKESAVLAKKRGLKVKIRNIESGLNFNSNFFDVVVASEVIEHILDTDFFIDEVKRVMKPNGVLVLSTPNTASLGRRILLLFGKNAYFEASFGYPPNACAGHIRFFTKDLLIRFLEHKGFKINRFMSDTVTFTPTGNITSKLLARLIPTIGRTLIIRAELIK